MRAPFGQNFLSSAGVAQRIATALGAGPDDRVIEIGPGRGALTGPVLSRCKHLTAVELDRNLADVLSRRWVHEGRLTVVNKDFMDWELPPVEVGRYKVIGNLPYSAAAAMVQKVLDWAGWDRAVFMVQKEVGLRMAASAGERVWGLLGLSVQSRAKVIRLFDVPPGAFRPVPKVMSTVLELQRLVQPRVTGLERFFKVARAAFGQRRKNIVNSLSHGLDIERSQVESVLTECHVDPSRRPETLTIEDFNRISQKLLS